MRDLYNMVTEQKLQTAGNITATTTSATCDLQGYDSSLFLITVGVDAALDSGDYWTITMQHSDDDSTYAVIAAADFVGANAGTAITATSGVLATIDATAEDDVLISGSYIGDKRYVQIKFTETSDTGDLDTPICITALKGHYKFPPAAAQA